MSSKALNLSSLIQAYFSIALSAAHFGLCFISNEFWILVAIPSSFWFFLILPILLVINFFIFIFQSIKQKKINKDTLIYFTLSLFSFYIFSIAINNDCYLSV